MFCLPIGYSIARGAFNSSIDSMGSDAVAQWSNEYTVSSIRVQLRHLAHWNGYRVAIPNLHHFLGSWGE